MTREDWPRRIDMFGLSVAPNKKRLHDVLRDHHADTDVAWKAKAAWGKEASFEAVSKDVFDDEYLKWSWMPNPKNPDKLVAVTLKAMLAELAPAHEGSTTGPFAHAMSYFDASQFVHSTPLGLRNLDAEIGREESYQVRPRPRHELRSLALILAATWTLITIKALADFVGADLEASIDETNEMVRALSPGHSAAGAKAAAT